MEKKPSVSLSPWLSAADPGVLAVGLGQEGYPAGHLLVVDPLAVLVVLPLPLTAGLLIVPLPLHRLYDAVHGQDPEKGQYGAEQFVKEMGNTILKEMMMVTSS